MFKLLPWTEGKYHILHGVTNIGYLDTRENDGVRNFVHIHDGMLTLTELTELHDFLAEQLEYKATLEGAAKGVKKAVKKLVANKAEKKAMKNIAKKGEKSIKQAKSKKSAADGVVKNPRGSKWDKYMDGKEHHLTLKQTGVAKIETARVAVSTYAKSRGYNVTTTVAGDKLTIKKN